MYHTAFPAREFNTLARGSCPEHSSSVRFWDAPLCLPLAAAGVRFAVPVIRAVGAQSIQRTGRHRCSDENEQPHQRGKSVRKGFARSRNCRCWHAKRDSPIRGAGSPLASKVWSFLTSAEDSSEPRRLVATARASGQIVESSWSPYRPARRSGVHLASKSFAPKSCVIIGRAPQVIDKSCLGCKRSRVQIPAARPKPFIQTLRDLSSSSNRHSGVQLESTLPVFVAVTNGQGAVSPLTTTLPCALTLWAIWAAWASFFERVFWRRRFDFSYIRILPNAPRPPSQNVLVSCPGDFVRSDSSFGIGVGPAEWRC